MKTDLINILKERNFFKLFTAVFFSELGGFLTNTVLLFHINHITNSNLFYLGLSQALFVGPLALGSLIGGALGESFNRRKILMICELANLFLVLSMVFVIEDQILTLIILRAFIVFFAGVYNPSRQSLIQELVQPENLRVANASFTTQTAALHCLGPIMGAMAYQFFGGIKEIFALNVLTYILGTGFIYWLRYQSNQQKQKSLHLVSIIKDVQGGFSYIWKRSDLNALLKNFCMGGFLLGIFYPSLMPFITLTFKGNEMTYGHLMLAFGIGGIIGGLSSSQILKFIPKGKILVIFGITQTLTLLLWTQIQNLSLSYAIIAFWGIGMMVLATTYISYVQSNISRDFQSRAFSLYDQSISLNVVIGALFVSVASRWLDAYQVLTTAAVFALAVMVLRLMSQGIHNLYKMET
jgi:predicted MFS family arabinose efflux permease